MANTGTGKLVILSGPSGVGKSTVVAGLIETCPLPLKLSISATTRPVRADDQPGKNYIFLTDEEFQARVRNGEFLEYTEVFGKGHWYGTIREQVITALKNGDWIILEIDVEGARKVKKSYPEAISIFLHPGSLEELERRLRGRATDDVPTIQHRLTVARQELAAAEQYDHIVVNLNIGQTVEDVCRVLTRSADSEISNP
jgi:guanylate kinase